MHSFHIECQSLGTDVRPVQSVLTVSSKLFSMFLCVDAGEKGSSLFYEGFWFCIRFKVVYIADKNCNPFLPSVSISVAILFQSSPGGCVQTGESLKVITRLTCQLSTL